MENMMKTFRFTTSRGERMCLSAIDEMQARRLFMVQFPRHRISDVEEIVPGPAGNV
jgi:hypothetical protein